MARRIPVQCEFWTDGEGKVTPIRFHVFGFDEEKITVKIGKTLDRYYYKTNGKPMAGFSCRSMINNRSVHLELCMDGADFTWYLQEK